MKIGNWTHLREKIKQDDSIIFQGVDKSTLSAYDKRKRIFDYLSDNAQYDYLLFIDILLKVAKSVDDIENYIRENNVTNPNIIRYIYHRYNNKLFHRKRDPAEELQKMITNHTGVCNSIAQYYKLLLEHNGIYSVCVICDNMLPKNHQINLIYDDETDTYSFDDVTTAILSHESRDKCFDYDLESAKDIKQGIRTVGYLSGNTFKEFDAFGVILRTEAIYYYLGRTDTSYLKYGLEKDGNFSLPNNIISRKKRRGDDDESTYRYKKPGQDRGL